jgi:hypothetical protein
MFRKARRAIPENLFPWTEIRWPLWTTSTGSQVWEAATIAV